MRTQRYLPVVACLLSACASAPNVDYYTVSMEPSGQARPTVGIEVERLQTTDALSRNQILIATSPTTIDYYATDLWAAGVGELVQLKLQAELGPPVEKRVAFLLSGTVLAFEQIDTPGGADALARLEIEVRDASAKRYDPPVLSKTYEARLPAANANPSAVAAALSKCLEQIVAEIATDLWSP
jgi:ABC-type uncharacterized transport system auxiliary subunit